VKRAFFDFWDDKLARRCGFLEKTGGVNPVIEDMVYDSRAAREGALFFALPGAHTDGHAYIGAAIERGARIIVHQHKQSESRPDVLFVRVKDARRAMSPLSAAFYREPSRQMRVIGVTGTEGKSTTVSLIFQLLRLSGAQCGFISTVAYSTGGPEMPNPDHQTTPEAPQIHRCLAQMRRRGVEYAVLESSSHGLSARTARLADVAFDAAVMTNVTHEHLEFHGTWECYRDDKANLFRALDEELHAKQIAGEPRNVPAFGVVNARDESADFFRAATRRKVVSFDGWGGGKTRADYRIEALRSGAEGNAYSIIETASGARHQARDKLPGAFNAGNVLAALLAVSGITETPLAELCALVPRLRPVRGRMTAVLRGQPFEVIVDYAHTPSSFQTIFPPLRERLSASGGKIIALFGSAGERDTQKRAAQGAIAAAYADTLVLTDEDPRGEDPMAILEEIARGAAQKRQGETLFLIPPRGEAIRKAFALARPGDLVLLLGKGHENSIIYNKAGKSAVPYDEIAEAERALAEMGYLSIAAASL
jgi:UDP-N-acetylmuramoyl-L-alanyl-D-glutamate--2,6-diaminopimelate ligase